MNYEAIIREYVNDRLREDREYFEEDEPIIEVPGVGPVYADQVDRAITEVFEQD